RREKDGVGVEVLLRAHREIERLEGPCGASIEPRQQLKQAGVAGDAADILVILPGVLDSKTAILRPAFLQPAIPVVLVAKLSLDSFRALREIRIREVNHGKAVAM